MFSFPIISKRERERKRIKEKVLEPGSGREKNTLLPKEMDGDQWNKITGRRI